MTAASAKLVPVKIKVQDSSVLVCISLSSIAGSQEYGDQQATDGRADPRVVHALDSGWRARRYNSAKHQSMGLTSQSPAADPRPFNPFGIGRDERPLLSRRG
jgi:hypothetical protein